MAEANALLQEIRDHVYDEVLASLYAPEGTKEEKQRARMRAVHVVQAFGETFPENGNEAALFSGPGRTEIGGNHTDHQHGHVLCGSVNLDILACAAPNGTAKIRIVSEGHPAVEVSLEDLSVKKEERNTSAGLVRGVAAGIAGRGLPVNGFDAYLVSDVLTGSGLSSSAAYEVLLGTIINSFFCKGSLSAEEIARIGQYAENVYFGKPCGLMDQMGSAVGGAVAIDFDDPARPVVQKVTYDFRRSGHVLCIIDTGSCHADLTDDYADIPREMGAVAACFGKAVLREVPEEQMLAAIPELRVRCGDRAVLRAMHYYADDRLAQEEAAALAAGDFAGFLTGIRRSGASSSQLLQNTCRAGADRQQAIPLALALAEKLLQGKGAVRVHGGGFAGTIQAFVPREKLEEFKDGMEAVFGEDHCHVLRIRPQGGCAIKPSAVSR